MRPIQIWVADTRAPGFAEAAHRQSLAAAEADGKDDIMQWVESVSDFDNEAR